MEFNNTILVYMQIKTLGYSDFTLGDNQVTTKYLITNIIISNKKDFMINFVKPINFPRI